MTQTPVANWSYPTAIRFGAGRIAEIGEACAQAGIAKPLLVTDRGLAALPVTANTLDMMESAGLGRAVFAEVDPNPTEINMDAGIAAYKAGGHDGVIAFGGGSGLDLGKMIAFMAGQSRPVWDFEDIGDWWTRADADAIAPIVAVDPPDGIVIDATGGQPLWFFELFDEPASDLVELALGGPITHARVESAIGYDLALENLTPTLYLPNLAGLAQGPGFPNLSFLGELSDRVLAPTTRPMAVTTRPTTVPSTTAQTTNARN